MIVFIYIEILVHTPLMNLSKKLKAGTSLDIFLC